MRKFLFLFFLFIPMSVNATQISGNAIYSWWTHPIAEQVGDDLYFTGINHVGIQRVLKRSNGVLTYFDLQTLPPDDHNAPSILIRPQGNLVFYTRHVTQPYVAYRRAVTGITFGPELHLDFPNSVTYSQILDDGDTVVVLTRSGSGKWRYRVSQDFGLTWGPSQDFITTTTGHRIYLTFQKSETDPGVWHIAGARNPADDGGHYIVYGTLDLGTGDVSNSAGVVGNLFTGLTIDETDLDDIQPVQNAEQKVRLLDVGDKGSTVIYYAKWGGGITSRYYQAVLENGVWTRTFIGIYTGVEFGPTHSRHYIGGVALDRNDNPWLYVSSESSGTWTIKKHVINTDMTLGTGTTLATNSKPLVRPYAVHNKDSVIYQQLDKYDSYKDYLSRLMEE